MLIYMDHFTEKIYYVNKWKQMDRRSLYISWNWFALLFGLWWTAYRKMHLCSIILVFVELSIKFPIIFYFIFYRRDLPASLNDISEKPSLLIIFLVYRMLVRLIMGIYGNYFYYRKVMYQLKRITRKHSSHHNRIYSISKKGGTSLYVMCFYLFIYYAGYVWLYYLFIK